MILEPEHQVEFTDLFISRKHWNRIRKPVISVFLIFNFYLIMLIFLSTSNLAAEKLLEPFKRYITFLGIEQAFNVFAPTPRQDNNHVFVSITYKNGLTELHALPRLERIPLAEKLFRERHRKFLSDNVTSGTYPLLYNDIARHIAKLKNQSKNNPPTIIGVYKYRVNIPPMENELPANMVEAQLELAKQVRSKKWAGVDKSEEKPDSEAKVPRAKRPYNRYQNLVNPPRYRLKVLSIYRVEPGDLK